MPRTNAAPGDDAVPVCPLARDPSSTSDEPEQRRWCNFLYTSKCPFSVNAAAGTMEPCKFLHLDKFVVMGRKERPTAPHAMTRHVKSLVKEMSSIFGSQAKRQLTGWFVQNAWGNVDVEFESVNPYGEMVAGLRRLGWVIPETTEKCTSARVEDAPYAHDVSTIVNVIANCLHYEIGTMPELMFDTIAWAFKLEKPAMRCPEVELEAGDIMEEFLQSEEVGCVASSEAEADADEDAKEVSETCSHVGSSSADEMLGYSPSGSSAASRPKAPQKPARAQSQAQKSAEPILGRVLGVPMNGSMTASQPVAGRPLMPAAADPVALLLATQQALLAANMNMYANMTA